MLTDEEKARIKAELQYREEVLEELRQPKKGWRAFWAGCSHPVVVTVIGGILIALAGGAFQSWSAVQQQNAARLRQLQDSKFALFSRFCNEFETSMTLFMNLRMKQLFLLTEKDKEPTGATRDDARKVYSELVSHFMQNRHPQAILAEVKAVFESVETKNKAADLTAKVQALLNERTPNRKISDEEMAKLIDIFSHHGEVTQEGMYDLLACMTKELRK